MTNNQIEILLSVRDKATKQLQAATDKMQGRFKSFGEAMRKSWLLIAAAIVAVTVALNKFTKAVVSAADKVEQYGVRMKVLLGSVREGNKVFKDMTELAARVPKTYDEIMAAATDLSAVVKGGSEEVKKLMEIVVELSSGTGIAVRETVGQMIRMYSAGAAAADMFRERGVNEALGFQAGVSFSAKETMKVITEQFEKGVAKFSGASAELAKTFTGKMSMLQDAWFNLRAEIGLAFIKSEEFKLLLEGLTETINKLKIAVAKWRAEGGMEKFLADLKVRVLSLQAAFQSFRLAVFQIHQAVLALTQPLGLFEEQYEDITQSVKEATEALDSYQEKIVEIEQRGFAAMQIDVEPELTALEQKITDAKEQIAIFFEEFKERFKSAIKDIEGVGQVTADALTKTFAGFSKSFGKAVADTIVYGTTFKGVMKSLAKEMAASFIASIVEMTTKFLIFQALQKVALTAQVAASSAAATMIASVWAPAAAMVSLATMGANAMPAAAALAGITALAKGMALAATQLAEGGIVTRPTFAMVGERGPEAVIPLSRGGGMGSTVNIEINNPIVRSDDDITALTEEISLRMAMETERL